MTIDRHSLCRWGIPACLSLGIVILWCVLMGRTSVAAWRVPVIYFGDGWLGLANAKAYMDGEIVPVFFKNVAHLNAPFGANWNDWPITEEFIFAAIGWLGRFVGLFAAANFVLMSAHVLAGLSFWFVARILNVSRAYALLGAVAYAFTHFIFARGFSHIVLAMYWHLPWMLLVVSWQFEDESLVPASSRQKISWIVSIVTGVMNPYYSWIYLQFLGFAFFRRLFRGQYRHVREIALLGCITVAAFVVMNVDSFLYSALYGKNQAAVERSLSDLLVHGMRLPELFLPNLHRWAAFEHFSFIHYYGAIEPSGESWSLETILDQKYR